MCLVSYVVSITHFHALRACGACEAGTFFMRQFLLPRRFQRGTARPQIRTHVQMKLKWQKFGKNWDIKKLYAMAH